MEFRILGPFEVLEGDRRVDIGGNKQRALLAVLLVHANEVVSTDRLMDELWGDSPPPTAAKTLQAHVSRLRRALGEESGSNTGGLLETHGRGYLLRVEPGQLDADRFRGRLEEGRRALAAGEYERAGNGLHEGLALWRGEPLADFAYESFAQAEIARLEELRVAALEERIEADLAVGRHDELIAELESLVDRHPLRERLRGQLMLALYRSDRQAEALQVYEHARHTFADELGLEPSESLKRLERRILEHDPTLAPPTRPARPRIVPARAWRHPWRVAVAGAVVLAVAVVAAVVQVVRDGSSPAASGGLGVLDPRTGELLTTVALGRAPAAVAVGDESVWVIDADDRTVSQIDTDDRTLVRTFATASTPTDIAAGAGAIWIGNAAREARFGGFPESVSRLDPESGVVDATIPLPQPDSSSFLGGGFERQHLAVTDAAVWAINPDLTVSRIDPRTNRVVDTVGGVRANAIAAFGREVWIAGQRGVARIDPRTNTVSERIEVAAESLTALAVGAGAVWAADPLGGSVWRIDPGPEPRLRTVPVEVGVGWVAFGEGAVWASNEVTDEIYRIDPGTNRARVAVRLNAPRGVAVGNGTVWGTATDPPSAQRELPVSVCSETFYDGPGSPRLLLVSDLPLQGGARPYTQPMVEAIRFVLERRGFRAGSHTVGYQSCDDSTAQAGGTDVYRCITNAKAYAGKLDVVGVIGAFQSFCSAFQIPIANRAPEGPLAMISPSNTETGLTRPYRGMRPGELADRYPTGERNFVRIAAADHLQAVAQVELAKQLGARRLFVAWDADDPSMAGFAADIRTAARRLRLKVVGTGTWRRQARRFEPLARTIASTEPQAVLLVGAAPPFVGALIRNLRSRLGPSVSLVAHDGFAGFDELIPAAGPAAQGMYVGQYGLPNAELPPPGRRFVADFAAARGSSGPDFSATYGAQAAEILLDAIARSDGTRASVNRELRRTRVENGILGDIRFDVSGDLLEGPFTYFRVVGDGVVVDRVVTARAALLER